MSECSEDEGWSSEVKLHAEGKMGPQKARQGPRRTRWPGDQRARRGPQRIGRGLRGRGGWGLPVDCYFSMLPVDVIFSWMFLMCLLLLLMTQVRTSLCNVLSSLQTIIADETIYLAFHSTDSEKCRCVCPSEQQLTTCQLLLKVDL